MENAQMENMNGCFRSSTIREKRHLIFTSWSCSDGKEISRKHLVLLIQLSWSSFSLFSRSRVLQFGARLVTLSAEPTVSFSCERFAAFCKEMYKTLARPA